MLANKTRTSSRSRPIRTSITNLGRHRTSLTYKQPSSNGDAATNSIASISTPHTGSIQSDFIGLDEQDYEQTRQIMHDLIDEIQVEKTSLSFNETLLDRDDVIGCLLRIFHYYADEVNGMRRIAREQLLELLAHSDIITAEYTAAMFISDWNALRKQMIKSKLYDRKLKTLDFTGFVQFLETLRARFDTSKDAIFKRIIGDRIYNDIIKLKEIRDRIRSGSLPSMETLVRQYNEVRIRDSTREQRFDEFLGFFAHRCN